MKQVIILLSFFLLSTHSFAQLSKSIPVYGKIDTSELTMKDCSFSPGADAVNLVRYDDITLSIYSNFNEVETKSMRRVKILNKSGFKYATVSIDYVNKASEIDDLEGATYNLDENGNIAVTKLDKSDIYKVKNTKRSRTLSFTFPNLKEGSIIEYRFTIRKKHSFSIPSWYFQNNLPTALSVCSINRPQTSFLQTRIVGDFPIEKDSLSDNSKNMEKRRVTTFYAMRNVPVFSPEEFMSSSRDYRFRADFITRTHDNPFSLLARKSDNIWQWENTSLLWHPAFGDQFVSEIPNTQKIIDSVKSLKNVSAKIAAIYKYVKTKIKWNFYYSILSRELKDVFEEGEGSSAEINLAILNLLRKCDVQCFPVLYSTRLHGHVDYNFVNLSQFNTVNIAVINGDQFNLLDGTSLYLSYNTPPLNVVNRTGMLIDPVNHTKINIDFDRKLIWDSIFVSASVDSNGMLKGQVVKKYFDLAKALKLQAFKEIDNDYDSVAELSRENREIIVDSVWQINKESEELPLTEFINFHYELSSAGDFYFLDPFIFSSLRKNPFTASTRNTDIDFGASSATVLHLEINLQQKIMIEELMKNTHILNQDTTIKFLFKNYFADNTIFIDSGFSINKSIFEKAEYGVLKDFFGYLYGFINNPIILKRK